MLTCFVKRILPFTLTFIVGAAAGGFVKLFHGRNAMSDAVWRAQHRFHEDDCPRNRRARAQFLLAESKPLVILFKPDARVPGELRGMSGKGLDPVRVRVTFGADGKVEKVDRSPGNFANYQPAELLRVWDDVERAARLIQFVPETINGLPVSVTKDVEIHFMAD